jgi:uncharacterized membrane protein YeiH
LFFFHPIYPHGVNEWTSSKHKAYINVHTVDVGYMTSLFFSSVKGGQFKKIILVDAGVSFFKTPTFVFVFVFFSSWYPTGIYWVLLEVFQTKNWSRSLPTLSKALGLRLFSTLNCLVSHL